MSAVPVIKLLILLFPVLAVSKEIYRNHFLPESEFENNGTIFLDLGILREGEYDYSTDEFPLKDYLSLDTEKKEGTPEGYNIEYSPADELSFEDVTTEAGITDFYEELVTEDPEEQSGDFEDGYDNFSDIFYKAHPLERIDLEECKLLMQKREHNHHFTTKGQNWYISTKDKDNVILDGSTGKSRNRTFTWNEAHQLCTSKCMELYSGDITLRSFFLRTLVIVGNVSGVWTSGRRCDFPGCKRRKDLKKGFGWFWSTSGKIVRSSYNTDSPFSMWSRTGSFNESQPDNAEFRIRGTNESCLAFLNNAYDDGQTLHDLPCYHTTYVLCQEPAELKKFRENLYNGIF